MAACESIQKIAVTTPRYVVLIQRRPARYYQRNGNTHRQVPRAQADRLSLEQAIAIAHRVTSEALAA